MPEEASDAAERSGHAIRLSNLAVWHLMFPADLFNSELGRRKSPSP